jgi:hypothetical protein
MVPAFYNATTGAFTAETSDVQVVLFSATNTYLSNTLTGLRVSVLPPVPAGVAPGAMTAELLSASLNLSATEQILANGTSDSKLAAVSTALGELSDDIYPLLSAANTVANNPTQTVNVTTANGATFTVSAQSLALSDQYAQALAAAIVTQGAIPAPTGITACPAASGNTAFDTNVCNLQTYFQSMAILAQPTLRNGPRPQGVFTKPTAAILNLYANVLIDTAAESLGGYPAKKAYAFVGAPLVAATLGALSEDEEDPEETDVLGEVAKYTLDLGVFFLAPELAPAYELAKVAIAVSNYDPPHSATLLSSGAATLYPGGITFVDPNNGTSNTFLKVPSAPQGGSYNSVSLVVSPYATTYTLTTSTTGSGTGTVSTIPSGTSFPAGVTVGLTATPTNGSLFNGWGGACSGTGSCSVTMNSNQSVTASFSPSYVFLDSVSPTQFNIGSVGGCSGGSISGSFSVNAGPGVSWTVTPEGPYGNGIGSNPTVTASPTSGTGPGVVTVTVTAAPQTPPYGSTCATTGNFGAYILTAVNFSDNQTSNNQPEIDFTFIGVE